MEKAMDASGPFSHWLATDLDGTLIPLAKHPENEIDLKLLRQAVDEKQLDIAFVTGRHLASVESAINEFQLPKPEWIIADVGSSIYRWSGSQFELAIEYKQLLESLIENWSADRIRKTVGTHDSLQFQESDKQSQYKVSFYVNQSNLNSALEFLNHRIQSASIPWDIVSSVDPFNGRGMIDLLPRKVNKAFAIEWWRNFLSIPEAALIFAGDSGNDLAAFEHGYRTIVVGNADRQIANRVFWTHENRGDSNQLFLSDQVATSGVVDGLRWFEVLPLLPTSENSELGIKLMSVNRSRFSVWAPKCNRVSLEYRTHSSAAYKKVSLNAERDGIFWGEIFSGPDTQYHLLLNDQDTRPDPRSRMQEWGVHGDSTILNSRYPWTDQSWRGVEKKDLVIYELHVGTFTQQGTYRSVLERLDDLIRLGITAIELLPLAECPGKWNWGYDGVHLFAPNRNYGTASELRQLIDTCHAKGLAVILDVVYNHLGPEGNYLSNFGPYFTHRHGTPWGDALNFDGKDRKQVRQLMVDNALYWLQDFHFDGLRLDAIHFMFDDSEYPITQEISDQVQQYGRSLDRTLHLIGEANIFDQNLIDSRKDSSYSAIWADCLMHSVYSHGAPEISLAHREYVGASDVAETLTHGFLYSGPKLQRAKRGGDATREITSDHLSSLIMALQTHDSVGNHPHGKRISHLTNVDFQMAAAPLFLLYPAIPMIFMGEEIAADSPFRFFADFLDPGLRKAVDRGRQKEYPNHQWNGAIAPSEEAAFLGSKLSQPTALGERVYRWYQDLLLLRREGLKSGWLDGEKISVQLKAKQHCFEISYSNHRQTVSIVSQLIPPKDEAEFGVSIEPIESSESTRLDSWSPNVARTGSSRCLINFTG